MHFDPVACNAEHILADVLEAGISKSGFEVVGVADIRSDNVDIAYELHLHGMFVRQYDRTAIRR